MQQETLKRLAGFVDRLRPSRLDDIAGAERNIRAEAFYLTQHPEAAAQLEQDVVSLLSLPYQTPFYGETGVRSGLGFWLELAQRIGQRLLPPPPDLAQLSDVVGVIFRTDDYAWVEAVDDEVWVLLIEAFRLPSAKNWQDAHMNILEALRVLSYRLAGAALDRELLRADEALERFESPFLAQNATLGPLLERSRSSVAGISREEADHIEVLLAQCDEVVERVRRKAGENGISVRLTYLLAQMHQFAARMRLLMAVLSGASVSLPAVQLFKTLLAAQQNRHRVADFVGENVSLIARNITDHASRHGEHYIARDPSGWWAMARSAAGGGVIIGIMAMIKVQLAQLHLPQLTEGIAYGLNYGLGFVLIHLLGFTVATKQPAMTAAAIAATLEESRPRDLGRLSALVQDVLRTQFVAVLGNVLLALPVALMLAFFWPFIFGHAAAPVEKAQHMLTDMHPWLSGSLFFAAVAGVGLFLSGLVSGYFDNQARYHQLAARIAVLPALARIGRERAQAFAVYMDAHYGAILGNLFFGMYLGLMGTFGTLTGLPIDIRHVAFGSANLGISLDLLPLGDFWPLFAWAALGVALIALVNLAVSFSLALYVALKSRRQGASLLLRLGGVLLKQWLGWPWRLLGRFSR
jgi:site-specific recombinase